MTMRALRERAPALLPRADVATFHLVAFALGAGAMASVALASLDQIIRLVAQQRPVAVSGDAVAVAVGVFVFCLARGLDRGALWVPLVHAVHLSATFFIALLVYVYLGRRATGDPLAQVVPTFTALLVAAGLGAALGVVARGIVPLGRADPPPLLVRAIGVAVIAGTVVHAVWPSSLFIAVAGAGRPDDIRTVLISLPDLFAGGVAGGIYAARGGATYMGLLAVGALLAVPTVIAQLALMPAQIARDPAVRGSFAVLFMLSALRIAAWPLAAAFVRGFMEDDRPPADDP